MGLCSSKRGGYEMIKIENIPLNVLEALRNRFGENEEDMSNDKRISELSPKEMLAEYCGWTLGDRNWAYDIIGYYEELKQHTTIEEDKK
jgi:uncharacterized protein YutD